MSPEQVLPYIGLPYKLGGEGPDGYNCWGLLRHVQAVYFGKDLPAAPLGDVTACKAMHAAALASAHYEPITSPEHGCAALMRGGDDPHVGIWLDIDGGGVLHSMDPFGGIWTPEKRLSELGFARCRYYRVLKCMLPSST